MHINSKDAYFIQDRNIFIMGSDKIEKKIELTDCGRFIMTSYINKNTGSEYIGSGVQKSDEFALAIDGMVYSGNTGGWILAGVSAATLKQGELEVVIALKNDVLRIERHYVIYPEVGVIQEWTVYENVSGKDAVIANPTIFIQRILNDYIDELDFMYMTGGGNFTGSTQLKTVKLHDGYVKDFDSQGPPEMSEIDGHYANKLHRRYNGTAMWFEFFALRNTRKSEGWYMTFDYQGWWQSQFTCRDRNTSLVGWCVLKDYAFPAGSSIKMPPMMTGVFVGDVDDLGNTINEYIYKYKWDYTRDKYFNRTNMTIWREAPLSKKVYKMVEAARYIGCERIWVDDFWFDAKGNWNGIFGDDWKYINEYIKKNGMVLRIWMPPWHADRLSNVWIEHPEWMLDFH
ncbi:MAG: hypothetical protein GX094_03400 [Clostridiales bacterium]|nr:hypothetical protein [Clostridiales bacterium]